MRRALRLVVDLFWVLVAAAEWIVATTFFFLRRQFEDLRSYRVLSPPEQRRYWRVHSVRQHEIVGVDQRSVKRPVGSHIQIKRA